MKKIIVLAGIIAAGCARAQTVRSSAGSQVRVPVANLTAAYSLDSDCAEAQAENGVLVVSGKRPCTTHIVVVTAAGTSEMEIVVSPRRGQLDQLRAARLRAQRIGESGSISTSYSSKPAELETSLNLTRSVGDKSTTIALTVADGYAFSGKVWRNTLPSASIQLASPASVITILDSRVDQSPLTIEDTVVRGLNVQSGAWFLHAGIVSLSAFRQELFERDPDRTVSAGYRFALNDRSGITASLQWISASRQYASGHSGAIGSVVYDYLEPERLRLQAEVGLSSGVGGSALMEYDGDENRVRLRVRSTPSHFPSLSTARAQGLQGTASWTRQFGENLGLDVSASRDSYSVLNTVKQTNASWSARLRWRPSRHLTLTGGAAGSLFTRTDVPSIDSISFPVGVSFDSHWFGNSFQYQFGRNRANELGSHAIRDSIRISLHSVTFTATASRQTQAPTISYLLTSLPWLRQTLLSAGFAAATPEQIQEFVRANGNLIAGGYVRDVGINNAPLRSLIGSTLSWVGPRNRVSARLEWRWNDDQQIQGRTISQMEDARFSVRLTRQVDFNLAASLLRARIAGTGSVRVPQLSGGIRMQLDSVPDILLPSRAGALQGIVFADQAGLGQYDKSAAGIPGVVVVLDGARRVRTNSAGFYSFGSLPPGSHSLDVIYEGGASHVFTSPPHVDADENAIVNFGIGRQMASLFGTVLNDALKPLGDVIIHLQGLSKYDVHTSSGGQFSVNNAEPGRYTVVLDSDSLPPSYSFEALDPKTVVIDAGQPGRADFVVRALRSVSGKIVCTGTVVNDANIDIRVSPSGPKVVLAAGAYRINDLPGGPLEVLVTYRSFQVHRTVELPTDPVALKGIDLEVCIPSR